MTKECDTLMESFISELDYEDDEIFSESMFHLVDNYIDDLVLNEMATDESIFETDNNGDSVQFTFIVDRVLEKINGDIDDQASNDTAEGWLNMLTNNSTENETDDHYFTTGEDFDGITPEDFQLYICNPNLDKEQECEYNPDHIDYNSSEYDSIFNA